MSASTSTLASASDGGRPRLDLDAVVDLVLRPDRFFRERAQAFTAGSTFLLFWVCGVATAIDNTANHMLLQSAAGGEQAFVDVLRWLTFWSRMLIRGTIAAGVIWLVWGWWFKVRIRWSGHESPDPTLARQVLGWAELINSAPYLAWAILRSFTYSEPTVLLLASSSADTVFVLLAFWSIWASYRGVRVSFPNTRRGPALFWFLVAPGVLLAVVYGGAILWSLLG